MLASLCAELGRVRRENQDRLILAPHSSQVGENWRSMRLGF